MRYLSIQSQTNNNVSELFKMHVCEQTVNLTIHVYIG